jgi:Bifunctional DNA primase/polymerase, N-terminal
MTGRAIHCGTAPTVDIVATAEGTATDLAKQGLPCFPCRNDKRPTTPRGFKDATREQSELREVWERYPGELVGVPTGEISGLDVLDIDPRHGGDHWFAEHKHHLLPTRVHRTRTGGLHLYYRHKSGLRCSAGKIAPGVDVRAAGGYVIWWPASGFPVLSDAPLATWPDWLLAALSPKLHSATAMSSPGTVYGGDGWLRGLARSVGTATDGHRNRVLFWASCRAGAAVREGKATENFVVDVLLEAARRAGLPRLEAQRTIQSGMRRS